MSTLSETAVGGDRLATLCDLRDLLARSVVACDSHRDLAALSGRLQAVLAEIDELTPKEASGDSVDEIARRRSARRASSTKGSGRAERPG